MNVVVRLVDYIQKRTKPTNTSVSILPVIIHIVFVNRRVPLILYAIFLSSCKMKFDYNFIHGYSFHFFHFLGITRK